jgi:hypothetical protein
MQAGNRLLLFKRFTNSGYDSAFYVFYSLIPLVMTHEYKLKRKKFDLLYKSFFRPKISCYSLLLQDSDLAEQQPKPGRPAPTPAVCQQILQPVSGETNNDDGKTGFTSQASVLSEPEFINFF